MRKQRMFPLFLVSIILIAIIAFLFRTPVFLFAENSIQQFFLPLQQVSYNTFGVKNSELVEKKKLQEEISKLRNEIRMLQSLKNENNALRDQYEASIIPTPQLLPVKIIGISSTTDNLHLPDEFVINAGDRQGVKVGQALIADNVLMGKVIKTGAHVSIVRGTLHKDVNISAYVEKNNVLGILKGNEDTIILSNVLLSDELVKGGRVLTKGDVSGEGVGIPPDVLIGEITSISKQPSALFQSAEVKPLIDFSKVSTAFIVVRY